MSLTENGKSGKINFFSPNLKGCQLSPEPGTKFTKAPYTKNKVGFS